MKISEKSWAIARDAQRVIKDKMDIHDFMDKFPIEELEMASYQLSKDKDEGYYKLIETSIDKKRGISATEDSNLPCGPLAKAQCDQADSISQLFSDNNVFLDIPYLDYDDCEDVLRGLLKEVGLNGVVAKDRLTANHVLCKVCRAVKTCKYGITDLSSASNSVSYEYGLMHGLGMKVCLLLREKSKVGAFSDIAGLEYAPPYSALRTLKISVAKWLKDNVPEANKEKIDEIIRNENAELKSKKDIPLTDIGPASSLSAEENEKKKKEHIDNIIKNANKAKNETKSGATRTLIAIPSKVKNRVIDIKELFKLREKLILFRQAPAEFPCSWHELENSQHALIYHKEFKGLDGKPRFVYVSMDDKGVLYYEETIFEGGAKSLREDIKEDDNIISVIFSLDRLYRFILFADNFYKTINYAGGIDIHYNFNNVRDFYLTSVDNLGMAHALGKNTQNETIYINKPISQNELTENQTNTILDIYEDLRFFAGAKEQAFARNIMEFQLESAKMQVHGSDTCPKCKKEKKPQNQDICLKCQKLQVNNPETSKP